MDFDTTAIDAHLYGHLSNDFRVGAFVGNLELGEIDFGGGSSFDVDSSVFTYGGEFQARQGALTYHGYAGVGDVEDIDNVDTTLYGVGAKYALSDSIQILGNYDGVTVTADGTDDEANFSSVSLGASYYLGPRAGVPVRLSSSISRDTYDIDGLGEENATRLNVGATFLLGGNSSGADRRRLFDSISLPF